MATDLMMLDVRNRLQWRTWLEKHHASSLGVWLIFFKEHTRVQSISYEDSVRQALCFGWIDSLIKASRQRPIPPQVHSTATRQQVVGDQPTTMGRTPGFRRTLRLRPFGRAGKHCVRPSTGNTGTAGLHCQSSQDES